MAAPHTTTAGTPLTFSLLLRVKSILLLYPWYIVSAGRDPAPSNIYLFESVLEYDVVASLPDFSLDVLQSDLTKQQNGFKITLKTLEDNLLSRLSSASGNFLGETALVENLEVTKQTAADVEEKVHGSGGPKGPGQMLLSFPLPLISEP